ncbi:protein kinase [Myxococcota bacterium]|nr:protein kinase [Myxococcota bacterium]
MSSACARWACTDMYVICSACHLPCIEHASRCPDCSAELAGLPLLGGADLSGAVFEKRYLLVERIGEGSMSWVYRGIHQEIGSSVAVKVLKPAFAEDPGQLARFRKEAAAISSLSHPHILSVIASGETSSRIHYMITEYIQGRSLAQVIETEGKLPLTRSLDILRQILFALEEAHGQGIVHRDLKPENIMVIPLRSGEDFCKIVDFGIALRRLPDESRLTKVGEIIGTPAFMAPEIIRGDEACPQSDLFSAGIIFYEMLCGDLPWPRGSLFETLLAHLNKEPVPVRKKNPSVPARIERLLSMALIKDPDHRISSATDFLHRLQFGAAPTISVCATCFQPVQGDLKFCPSCGRLQEPARSESGAPASEAVTTTSPTPEPALAPASGPVVAPLAPGKVEAISPAPALTPDGNVRSFAIPFWGRADESSKLREFLAGSTACLELVGEPGVGKSALLNEILSRGTDPDLEVLQLMPDPLGGRRSWWPIRRLVTRLCGLPVMPEAREVASQCKQLGLEPEDEPHVLELFDVRTEPVVLEYRVHRREMIYSVARLVLRVVGKKPTLLVCADADRLDGPSLDVIDQLVTLCPGTALRLALTGTNSVFPDAAASRSVTTLRLGRFTNKEARGFCREVLDRNGTEAGDSLGQLLSAAEGLPLHLVEGLRLLHEGLSDVDRPLSDIVQSRVRSLPGPAHRLVQWMAVAGGRLPLQFVLESGLIEPASIEAIMTCVRQGFLTPEGDEAWRLVHPSFEKIILAEMSTALRLDMHNQLFDRLRVDSPDPRSLCDHALQARQLESASSYFEHAGAICEDKFDDPGAVLHYRRAYELTEFEARQGRDTRRFLSIAVRYGDLLRFTGHPEAASRVLQEALLNCQEEDAATALILVSLARCVCGGNPGHAEVLIQRAVRAITKSRNPREIYRVFFDIGQIALETRRFEQGMGSIRTGLSLLEGARGLSDSVWRLHLQCAQCEAGMGRIDQAEKTCLGTLERVGPSNSWLAQARFNEELAHLHITRREPHLAADRLRLALAALRFTGDRVATVENELRLAVLDRENRLAWAQSALNLARTIGYQTGVDRAMELVGPE